MFDAAEQAGMKLAIKGRLAALAVVGLLLVLSRGPERAPDFILAITVFAILGIVHFRLIGSTLDRWWVKYAFLAIDVALLSALLWQSCRRHPRHRCLRFSCSGSTSIRSTSSSSELRRLASPPALCFGRAPLAAPAGWAPSIWVHSQMVAPLTWSDIPDDPTAEQFLQGGS